MLSNHRSATITFHTRTPDLSTKGEKNGFFYVVCRWVHNKVDFAAHMLIQFSLIVPMLQCEFSEGQNIFPYLFLDIALFIANARRSHLFFKNLRARQRTRPLHTHASIRTRFAKRSVGKPRKPFVPRFRSPSALTNLRSSAHRWIPSRTINMTPAIFIVDEF